MFGGKGMQDMLANLAQRILGMSPEELRGRIEETGTLIKNTLAHFDARLAALEKESALMRATLERLEHGEEIKSAGYGAASRALVGCPDFNGPGRGDANGGGTVDAAGTPNGEPIARSPARTLTQ